MRREIVGKKMMDEGTIAEDFEGLPETKASRVKLHRLTVTLLLLESHCRVS